MLCRKTRFQFSGCTISDANLYRWPTFLSAIAADSFLYVSLLEFFSSWQLLANLKLFNYLWLIQTVQEWTWTKPKNVLEMLKFKFHGSSPLLKCKPSLVAIIRCQLSSRCCTLDKYENEKKIWEKKSKDTKMGAAHCSSANQVWWPLSPSLQCQLSSWVLYWQLKQAHPSPY